MTTVLKKIKTSSVPMTFRVSSEVRDGLEILSDISKRSRAYLAEEALTEYVNQNAWQAKILQERAIEADKGIFVSHERVGKWIKAYLKDRKTPLPKADVIR